MENKDLIKSGKSDIFYNKLQIEKAELDHDWTYNMKIKFSGSTNESNYFDITKNQLIKIKKILIK